MKISQIQTKLTDGDWESCFEDLGIDSRALPALRLPHRFEVLLGMASDFFAMVPDDEVYVFSSPGRFILLGEYMELLQGQVIGGPIAADILALVRYRHDGECNLASWGYEETIHVMLDDIVPKPEESGEPESFIRGMACFLSEAGFTIYGCDICIHSMIPSGNGLSSSSAFAILVGMILTGHDDERKGNPPTESQLLEYCVQTKINFFGRSAYKSDALLCLKGPLRYLDFRTSPMEEQVLKLLPNFSDYSLFLVETWEAFNDEEDERDSLEHELVHVQNIMAERNLQPFLSLESQELILHLQDIRETCGERALLRAFFMIEENKRIQLAFKAMQSGQGLGTLLDLINISTATSYRQLQNLWPESHPRARGLVLGIELTERWLRAMGMPGAAHVHGRGFYGSFYTLVPRNMGHAYKEFIESIFGVDSAKELFLRGRGACKIC